MRALKFVGALVAVFLVHVLAVDLFPSFPRFVDLFLVLLVLNALNGATLSALLGGCVAGLVEDSVSGGIYGLHSFAGTLVGYGTAQVVRQFFVRQLVIVGLFFGLAAAFHQALLLALRLFLMADPEVPALRWLVAKSVVCGLLGTSLFVLNNQLKASFHDWRFRRRSKLRFEKGV